MRYVIVCLVEGEALVFHEKLTSEVCKLFQLRRTKLPAHITLKAPFEAENISELEKIIEDFTSSNTKAPMKLEGYKNFRRDVVYMDVQPSKEAVEIHDRLSDSLKKLPWLEWKANEGKNKVFHCTIVSKKVGNKFQDVMNHVSRYPYKYTIDFDNITIFQWEENTWKLKKKYIMD
ncbi:MAG: 2'-5' RNA ligase family protein [Bacillota bacterium]|nr:2'-5' RNA ligase family protein [Bacillota bacterium]